MNSFKGTHVHGWLSEANIPFPQFPFLRTSCICPIVSWSSQNDVASDAFTRVVWLTHTHVGKTLGKQFKHWWCYFWMRKWRVQKNGHSWVLPMVGIDPTHLLLGFIPGVSGETYIKPLRLRNCPLDTFGFFLVPWQVSVCGPSARWMKLGWFHHSHPRG